jgi:hypothetical protein
VIDAVLAYVYDYLEGLNQVPSVVNNLARWRDVRRRLSPCVRVNAPNPAGVVGSVPVAFSETTTEHP